MALIEVNPARKGGNYGESCYVSISSTKGTQTNFTLSPAAMIDLRWVVGDRVKILIDPDTNEVHLRRAAPGTPGSFSLSPQNTLRKDALGKPVSTNTRTSDTRFPRIDLTRLEKDDCYIADNGDLVFIYPVPINVPQPEKAPVVAIPADGKVIGTPRINHRDNQRHTAR